MTFSIYIEPEALLHSPRIEINNYSPILQDLPIHFQGLLQSITIPEVYVPETFGIVAAMVTTDTDVVNRATMTEEVA